MGRETVTENAGQLLEEADLASIERTYAEGLTSGQIIQIFQSRGVRLSEATFRKYVQLGLLPRSRRIGSKGKHRGSRGIYPSGTVRRINSIKGLMARNFTIEEIQRSFAVFKQQIDELEGAMDELLQGFDREVAGARFGGAQQRGLQNEIDGARNAALELVRQLVGIETRISTPEKSSKIASDGILTER